MTSLFLSLPLIGNLIQEYEKSLPFADVRTRDWFMVNNTPVYVWLLTATYLAIVWYGPKYMQHRQPYHLQGFMVVYNLGLVALSIYMFVEIYLSTWEADYDYYCAPYNEETRKNPKELRVAKVMWWYFFSKVIELMDTVVMVLRKRNRQITFLHVFHHASMLNIWWWVMMFIPGGLSYFGSSINCLVHVVMYLYYGLSAIPSLREHLWWKKYITQFQLTQFCITLSHTLYTFWARCDFPMWGQKLLAAYMLFMLIFFTNFYIHAYYLRHQQQHPKAVKNGVKNGKTNGVKNGNHSNIGAHISNGHSGSGDNGKKKL